MSLICLSSRGLSDTASNYTNFFGGRGIEFPKNSEICLVGASIKKHRPSGAVHTIANEAGTFAIHYGGQGSGNNDLLRDDVIVQEQITGRVKDVGIAVEESLKKQMTCSPLRHFPDVVLNLTPAPATGFTFKFPMAQCRNTLPGYWKVPQNLPFIADVIATDTATGTILTPEVGSSCWIEDSRVLFNTDNQGTAANYAADLEGARFEFTWTTGDAVALYAGMQGGIVTGDRLLDAYEPHSWVNNPNKTDAENPATDTYEQKIDLGYEIQKGASGRFTIVIFKNTFVGNGYERTILSTQQVPPAGADQTITILFRPIVGGGNAGWEVATKIGAAAYAQQILVAGTDENGSPVTATGNFPIAKYNGNGSSGVGVGINCVQFWGRNNDAAVGVEGCYDNDPAIALIAPALAFPSSIYMVFSNISDAYAAGSGVTANMRRLAQTRCNSSDSFGMASGQIQPPFDTSVGLASDALPADWGVVDTPLCVQLPNLPITGYLGGGASYVGGATNLPILGIVDAFELLPDAVGGSSIYEPTQENWIKLMNKDSFTINELQVRITDLFGVLPDYLDTPTHVWVKIKAGTLEKV